MFKFIFTVFALALVACNSALTAEQTQQALEESSVASQADTLMSSSVELVFQSEFTIGDAVDQAAQKIKSFIASQLPCAQIAVEGATLAIEYGFKPADCEFNGQAYAGEHSVAVQRNQSSEVMVRHKWTDFTNYDISVSGTADVTWNAKNKSRRVEYDLTWTTKDDDTGYGSGERTQTALAKGLVEGIKVQGERTWEGKRGQWKLEIDDIEMRWVDPVPQAGSWILETPFDDKSLTLSFDRKSETEIEVKAKTGGRNFKFIVRKSGKIVRSN